MNTILTLLLFILVLGITVFVHELGHFLFAKIVGVHVYEFSLGFGPVIFKHIAKDKTQYSIRCFPLGGFVSLAGEEQDVDLTKHKGHNLQDKNVFQRFLVMVMGVGFNFIFAFLMLFMIGSFYTARDLTPVLNEVNYNSPAAKAGLEKGDKVLEINNHKIKYFDDIFVYLTIEDLSKPVSFKVEKQDKSIVTYIINPEKIKQDDKEHTSSDSNMVKNNDVSKTKSLTENKRFSKVSGDNSVQYEKSVKNKTIIKKLEK